MKKEQMYIRRWYSGDTLANFDALVDKSEKEGAVGQFAIGKEMIKLIHPYMAPDDGPVYRDAIVFFESAAQQGHVEAMEYCVRLYASGLVDQQVVEKKTESVTILSNTVQPNWEKAHDWCVKAKDAGGTWAAEVYPQLCKDIASAEAIFVMKPIVFKKPATPAAPKIS